MTIPDHIIMAAQAEMRKRIRRGTAVRIKTAGCAFHECVGVVTDIYRSGMDWMYDVEIPDHVFPDGTKENVVEHLYRHEFEGINP